MQGRCFYKIFENLVVFFYCYQTSFLWFVNNIDYLNNWYNPKKNFSLFYTLPAVSYRRWQKIKKKCIRCWMVFCIVGFIWRVPRKIRKKSVDTGRVRWRKKNTARQKYFKDLWKIPFQEMVDSVEETVDKSGFFLILFFSREWSSPIVIKLKPLIVADDFCNFWRRNYQLFCV